MRTLELALGVLFIAAVAVAPGIQAQSPPTPSSDEVIGFSYIVPGTGPTVTAYAGTEMGTDVAAYYDCALFVTLSGPSGSAGGAGGGPPTCEGTLSLASAGGTFTVTGYHYLFPTGSPDEDNGYVPDPFGFAEVAPRSGGSEIDVFGTTEFNPDDVMLDTNFYLGSTTYQQFEGAPVIQGISAQSGSMFTLGNSGTMQIVGAWLTADGTDLNPQVTVASGSGLTLGGVSIVNDGQLNVDYAVGSNPSSAGDHGIQVTTVAGQSNSYNVLVGDPTPVISSITSPWNAGATYPCGTIQIAGSGFGTNPTVQIVSADGGNEIASYGICGSNDGLITLSVTTNVSYTPGSVNVSVTSRGYTGYNGNSFQPSQQNNSSQSPAQAVNVNPVVLPAPYVVLGTDSAGSLCAGASNAQNPNQAVIGQKISFTGCVPALPNGVAIQNTSWSPANPPGTAVGGFQISATSANPSLGIPASNVGSGTVVPLTAPSCSNARYCDFPPFYWADTGFRQFTFTYQVANAPAQSVTLQFNVGGPTGLPVNAPTGVPGVYLLRGQPAIVYAGNSIDPAHGIDFSASVNAVSGAGSKSEFVWVQLRHGPGTTNQTSIGVLYCALPAFVGTGADPSPALDTSFPYATGGSAYDSPFYNLIGQGSGIQFGETRSGESFDMYLMWDPALPSGCQPWGVNTDNSTVFSACSSIPVPLGLISWSYGCSAINTLQNQASNNTNWTTACPLPSQQGKAQFNSGVAFPTWGKLLATGTLNYRCQGSPYN